jgi:DNA segregation ATPase FtsK/SpoIIIE-like protein
LLPGQDWDLEIEKALETADAVIVFLSDNSVTKDGYIQKEIRKIIDVAEEKPDGTIFIIPVRLNDCPLPRRFKTWQYEDYFPQDKVLDAYKRIRKSLSLRAKSLGIDLSNYSTISSEDENALLLQDAIFLARTNETVLISLLQRRLRIGYTKSEWLINQMEKLGIVEKLNESSTSWNHVVKYVGE